MAEQLLTSRDIIIGQMVKQVNLGKCTNIAVSALVRRDIQIKGAKEGLKKDLLWNFVGNLKAESESAKKVIERCIEKWFPVED